MLFVYIRFHLDEAKNSEIFCTWSARHTLSHPRISIVYSWNVDGEQVTSLVWKKTQFFHPHMIRGPHEIPNCVSTRHPESYPRIISTSINGVDVVQKTHFTEERKRLIFDSHLAPWDKMKILKPKIYPNCLSKARV